MKKGFKVVSFSLVFILFAFANTLAATDKTEQYANTDGSEGPGDGGASGFDGDTAGAGEGASIEGIIPAAYRTNWEAGVPGGIPSYPVKINVKDFGASGNGTDDDTDAFKEAIGAAEEGTAVLIPSGTYRITDEIRIQKGIVLRGEGYDKSRLMCRLGSKRGSCISISKSGEGHPIDVTGGHTRGSTQIIVANASGIKAGDYLDIDQDNDPAVYKVGYSGDADWGKRAVGQIVRVTKLTDNALTLERPLRYEFSAEMNPRVRRRNVVKNAGVEDLRIDRMDTTYNSTETASIMMRYAVASWVKGVWLEKNLRTHVRLWGSYRCEIRDSVFNDSHLHGGGEGYGVTLYFHATDNLVENNTFVHLRHSMIMSLGANGNVFGYNYSRETYTSQSPGYPIPDLSCHGYYPFLNLFEGNTGERIGTDHVWGTNGPTTFFRNRIVKPRREYGAVTIKPVNYNHNVVGNELGNPDASGIVFEIHETVADTILCHGNYDFVEEAVQWDPSVSQHELPPSLYLKQKPEFLGDKPWPLFGPEAAPSTVKLPAQERYDTELTPTVPDEPRQLRIRQ